MSAPQNPIKYIAEVIQSKSAQKQQTYRNLCESFKLLEKEARKVVKEIKKNISDHDKDIVLSVSKVSSQEFHVHIAGELLIFFMHTNIIVLDDAHGYAKSEYVAQDDSRKYLGQINVYNFMADSFKYNRLKDPGYLIARLFINVENHFLVEGERQLNFMFENVSIKPISQSDLSIITQLVISQSLDNDLITSPFPSIRVINVHQKIEKSQDLGGGHKIGFQMSYQSEIK